jgi:hypothetical protein
LPPSPSIKRPIRIVDWDVRIFSQQFFSFLPKTIDFPHGARPKSTELIYPIYNTFPTFLSRLIGIVSGRYIANIVANPGKHPQNGTNKKQNCVPLRKKGKNCDDEKYETHFYKMFVCFAGGADSVSNERGQTEGRF